MRLTCPSCAAQYEVSPEAIPPQGRDVQCSACGHTWFEHPGEAAARTAHPDPSETAPRVENDPEEADDLAEIEAAPAPPPPSPPPPAPPPQAPRPSEAPAAVPPMAATAAPAVGEPVVTAAPERQRVPAEVERILREEAQHEARVRAEEAARRAAAATEPGPVPVIERPAGAPPRSEIIEATVVSEAAPPVQTVAVVRPARHVDREIDIDRINSTLRSQADRLGTPAPRLEGSPERGGSGFARGFWGALLAIALLVLIYAFRGPIIQAVPPTAAVLDPYAQAVGAGRDWLDRQVARAIGADAPAE